MPYVQINGIWAFVESAASLDHHHDDLYHRKAAADAALAAKAPLAHTHTLSGVLDAGTAASRGVGVAEGDVPLVGAGGKLASSLLPALAVTDTFVVASLAAMLALAAERGDVAVRTDESRSYILRAEPAAAAGNWQELAAPAGGVSSVDGRAGSVTLGDLYAPLVHGHAFPDVAGLQDALDQKSDANHDHAGVYAPAAHGHAAGDLVSGVLDVARLPTGTAANQVPVLGAGGKLNSSVLPPLAITDTFVAATQAAMLALVAEVGDVAVRTDLGRTYILQAEPASSLANWQEVRTPTDAVLSVDGRTGAVTLNDLYAAAGHNHAGVYSAVGHGHALADVAGLAAALDAKVAKADFTAKGQVLVATGNGTYVALAAGANGEVLTADNAAASGLKWAAAAGGSPFTTMRQTANVTVATATLNALPGMAFDFAANSFYVVEAFLVCTSAATATGYRLALDVSAAVTHLALLFVHVLGNAGTLSGGSSAADNAAQGLSSGVNVANTNVLVYVSAVVVTGANAGTAQLTWGPEVAASATCRAGSLGRVQKVA